MLFYNPGAGERFVNIGYALGVDIADDGRAMVPVDIDGDGDLDLVRSSLQGLRLLENRMEARRFVRVKLLGAALGANVTVRHAGVAQQDFVKITSGFQSQVPDELHFGLGTTAAETVEAIEIRWASGRVDTLTDAPVGKQVRLREGGAPEYVEIPAWPEATRPRTLGSYDLGAKAKTVAGGEASIGEDGSATVVNFWAPWCEPCKEELPVLARLAKRYAKTARFVGLSVETEDTASVSAAIEAFGLSYAQLYASPAILESFFGKDGSAPLPSTFIFDREGALQRVLTRKIGEADLVGILEGLAEEPPRIALLRTAADTALARGDHEAARAHLERALAIDPKDAYLTTQLSALTHAEGDAQASLRIVRRATKLDPELPYAWYRLAWTLRESKALGEARKAIKRALALRSDDPTYGRLAVAIYGELGELPAALVILERLVLVEPDAVDLWIGVAEARHAVGREEDALAAIRKALELAPADPRALRVFDQVTKSD